MTPLLKTIPCSDFKKPLFSRWQKIQVLLDAIELENLLQYLSSLVIVNISEVLAIEKLCVCMDTLMNKYQRYIDMLQGKISKQKIFLAYALSQRIDNFRGVLVAQDQYICRPLQPEVHMQAYEFLLDSRGKILPQVFSKDAISWGIQLAYPAIFQDPHTMEVFQATRPSFPGWKLFSNIRSWIRTHTLPLPIHYDKKVIHLPIRIGKKAVPWIENHIDRSKIPICTKTLTKFCQKQTI